jgi:5'-nucleotidase
VSNISFAFDADKPPGSRIIVSSVKVADVPVDAAKVYVMATRGYMARGRDGYRALLIKSEGGECEEVVSEENGILISMLLRQYFMSLKVMNQWTQWSEHMGEHWDRVVKACSASHPHIAPGRSTSVPSTPVVETAAPGGKRRKNSWAEWTPKKLRERRASLTPLVEHAEDSDTDIDEDRDDADKREQELAMDRELKIMRSVFKKWCRVAGVRGDVCDSLPKEEFEADWTSAIAPQVEGRITIIGDKTIVTK